MPPAGVEYMGQIFQMAPGCESLLAAHGLGELEAVFNWRAGERLDKPGLEQWRQRWRIVIQDPDAVEHTLYLKRFERPPVRRQTRRWRDGHPGLSTAGVEWANARQLAEAGISAAEPIAFGQDMTGPWERRSFILLRQVPGESLERWLPVHLPPADRESNWTRRRARLDELARFVGAFHRAGFAHRDLYLSHVFIRPASVESHAGGRAGEETFCLIDLQRVFRPRWRRRRWVVKDLAALNYSTPIELLGKRERLRFLCRYVRRCGRFASARRLARLVGAKTARMARRTPAPQT